MYDSKLERKFHSHWKQITKTPLVLQHKFHSTRQWRFDFAHIPTLTAIEIQGFGEGHTSYDGMHSDYVKHNEAIRHGWVIIYLMSKDLGERNITRTIRYILDIIQNRPQRVQNIVKPIPRSPYEDTIRKLLDD